MALEQCSAVRAKNKSQAVLVREQREQRAMLLFHLLVLQASVVTMSMRYDSEIRPWSVYSAAE